MGSVPRSGGPGGAPAEMQRLRTLLKMRGGLDVSRMSDQEVWSQVRLRFSGECSKPGGGAPPVRPASTSGSRQHFLIAAGIRFLQQKHSMYGEKKFPAGFYEQLARHLFEETLKHSDRDYGDAFSLLNALQDARLGTELQKEYERLSARIA